MKKAIAAMALAAVVSVGTIGLAACDPKNENSTPDNGIDHEIFAVYTAYAETMGDDALSYDEWYELLLSTAKGDKGDKGDNGEDGKSAYELWLEQEGNEGKTQEEFFASLKGEKGDDGEQGATGPAGSIGGTGAIGPAGERGNKITHGTGAPTSTDGAIDGDMYVDTTNWNVYFFDDTSWQNAGSIKGKDGVGGGTDTQPAAIQLNITSGDEQQVNINLSEGIYLLKVDLGDKTLTASTGKLTAESESGQTFAFNLSNLRSTAAGVNHNVYCGFVNAKTDLTSLTFKSAADNIQGELTYETYSVPTFEVGDTYVEVPITSYSDTANNKIDIPLGSSVVANKQYKLTATSCAMSSRNIKFICGTLSKTLTQNQSYSATFSFTSDNISSASGYVHFEFGSQSETTKTDLTDYITFKLEEVAA